MSNSFSHGYALLIGVGETSEPQHSLPVTVRDVRAIHAILTDQKFCGYSTESGHLRILHDSSATRNAILEGLDWLKEAATKDSEATVLVYYSGHGGLDTSTEQYYLVQHDFKCDDIPGTALSAQEFSNGVRQIKAKSLLVIIDSCHAEGMATSKEEDLNQSTGFLLTAPLKSFTDTLRLGAGRAVFTSCRGKQSSYIRPDGTMSVYTYHLIEALKGAANRPGDELVKISHLMNYLAETVPASVRKMYHKEQTPFFDFSTEDFPVALLLGGKGLLSSNMVEASPKKIIASQEVLQPALQMARRALAIFEQQAAGYGSLKIPPELLIQLEDKRLEVASLEARLKVLEVGHE
jgi:Caspase domain